MNPCRGLPLASPTGKRGSWGCSPWPQAEWRLRLQPKGAEFLTQGGWAWGCGWSGGHRRHEEAPCRWLVEKAVPAQPRSATGRELGVGRVAGLAEGGWPRAKQALERLCWGPAGAGGRSPQLTTRERVGHPFAE